MGRKSQVKASEQYNRGGFSGNNYTEKVRLSLNDLLKNRQEEKKVEKKTNVLIFSGASVVVAAVFVILIL